MQFLRARSLPVATLAVAALLPVAAASTLALFTDRVAANASTLTSATCLFYLRNNPDYRSAFRVR